MVGVEAWVVMGIMVGGECAPPPWYVPVWGKMSPSAQNFTGVPLGGTPVIP